MALRSDAEMLVEAGFCNCLCLCLFACLVLVVPVFDVPLKDPKPALGGSGKGTTTSMNSSERRGKVEGP